MAEILFSYRSSDTAVSERILERLQYNYGREHVHTDASPTARGAQSLQSSVEDTVAHSTVFVVVIGPTWIQARNGARRLEDPQDVVRLELAAALARAVPVIPILVRGARMPEVDLLPDELKPLTQLEPHSFGSDATFRGDMMRLHRRVASISIEQQDAPEFATAHDDQIPDKFRRGQLNAIARARIQAGKAPFEGVRMRTVGEVLWILGARSSELSRLYGERQFDPDLSKADLSYLDMTGADLYAAKLMGANLTHANLSGAKLSQALLSDADLTEANLAHATLTRAILPGARLQLADLTGCSLEGANLSSTDLTTATLSGAVLDDATLQAAKLIDQVLPDASLKRADLSGADLTDAMLHRAQLEDANLDGARLDRTDLSGAWLAGADLSRASLKKTDLSAANLAGATVGSVKEMGDVIIDAGTRFEHVKWGGKAIKDPRGERDHDQQLRAYREDAQTYRDIAAMLREAGFLPEASRYRLMEQRMRRGLLLAMGRYDAWLFSSLLNAISGYGERVSRTLLTYLIIVLSFSVFYFIGANELHLGVTHLSATDALVASFAAFHGRGFVSSTLQLGNGMAWVTVLEGACGLFVEAIFIATFSRRFLGS